MDTVIQPPLELKPGNLILEEKYRVDRRLDRGGMGEVWLITHVKLDVQHVIKVIRQERSQDDDARARFTREAWVTSRFSHPNAVVVHDFGIAGDDAYLIVEYIQGHNLRAELEPGKPMPLDWTSRILSQLCDVLQVAHDHDPPIVHRDLKPENLMVVSGRPEGQEHLKVLDFGIAKILDATGSIPGQTLGTKGPLGTPSYMSPEQIRSGLPQEESEAGPDRDTKLDGRSDVYAVGVILYELLTGWRPFDSNDPLKVLRQHLHDPPPRFSERNAQVNVPRFVEKLVLRCLAKKPGDRPRTAQELAQAFRLAVAEPLPPGPSPASGDGSTRRVNSSLVIGSGVVALAAIGLVLGLLRSSTNDSTGKAAISKSQTTGPGEQTKQAKVEPISPPSSSSSPKPTQSSIPLAKEGSTTKDRQPTRPASLPQGDIVESILHDVRTQPTETRPFVRYLSFTPPAPGASADYAAILNQREKLMKALAQHSRKAGPIHLREIESSRTLVGLDIRDLGWDERPFQIIRDGKPVGPTPVNLYDLILLEYPFATADASSSTFRQLVKEYFAPAELIRPIASVRADWLAEVVTRAPLASDLKGRPLEDRPRLLDRGEAPGQRWLGTSGAGAPIVPIDGLSYAEIRPNTVAIDVELRTNHPDHVFAPGDRMVITVTNRSAEPVLIELVGTDTKGRQAILTSAPTRVAPGREYRYPLEGQGIEIGDEPGREMLTVMASSAEFPAGILLRGNSVADRVIHAFDHAQRQGSGSPSSFSAERFLKKAIVIETRPARLRSL